MCLQLRARSHCTSQGSWLTTMLLVSPMFVSSDAHRQDLCSSTPENLLGFFIQVVCFQKCIPKSYRCLKLAEGKMQTHYTHSSVFLVVFKTHPSSSSACFLGNFSQTPQHFVTEPIMLLSSLSPSLKSSDQMLAIQPYIELYSPLSCAMVCGDAKWLHTTTESARYFIPIFHWQIATHGAKE